MPVAHQTQSAAQRKLAWRVAAWRRARALAGPARSAPRPSTARAATAPRAPPATLRVSVTPVCNFLLIMSLNGYQ